jgi:ABC-type glycerol-3-phosphate transport system substrate-binding protein
MKKFKIILAVSAAAAGLTACGEKGGKTIFIEGAPAEQAQPHL